MNAFRPPSPSLRFIPVWRRNFLVWRKLAIPSVLGNLADPMIYMLGLGYGLGALLPEVGGVSYLAFLAAGTVCFSTMNAATFEALYSAFSRMQVQKTWEAILNAPVALDDLVLAELVWAASRPRSPARPSWPWWRRWAWSARRSRCGRCRWCSSPVWPSPRWA